jgi:hypothetical protein
MRCGLNQVTRLYEFSTAEKAPFADCQVNFFTGKGHNLYGIDIPFQFDGRDGTMTATDGVDK